MEYISLRKVKREIPRAHPTSDPVFLCCMPRRAVLVYQMHSMQGKSDDDSRLDQFRVKLCTRIHKWATIYDRERAEFGELPSHPPARDHQIRLDTDDNAPPM